MASEQHTPETVYCFRKSTRRSEHVGPGLRGVGIWVNLWIILGIAAMPQLFPQEDGAMPSLIPLGVAAILVLVLAWMKRCSADRTLPADEPGLAARLSMAGRSYHPRQMTGSTDADFHPVVFPTTAAVMFTTAMDVATVLLMIVATPSLLTIHWFVLYPSASWAARWLLVCIPLEVFLASWGPCQLVGWLCPAYFRIAPGRLEVTRLNRISGRRMSIEHYDLPTARILVDEVRDIVFLDDADGRRAEFYTGLMLPRKQARLASKLFLAALSGYQAPDLPDDRLLG
jgi:hypothetical protein